MLHPINLLPFMGVEHEHVVNYNGRHFHIFTYQAYNAFGLIGSEHNGIAICDVDKKHVLCDGIARESTGYFGASKAQVKEWKRICRMTWEQFQAFVNSQPSARYTI